MGILYLFNAQQQCLLVLERKLPTIHVIRWLTAMG